MKKLLFVLATSTLMLASCGGTPASSSSGSQSGSSSTSQSTSLTTSEQSSETSQTSSATTESSQTSEATTSSEEDITPEGLDVAYIAGLKSGGEGDAYADPGYLYEWHGDGGSVTNWSERNGVYTLEYAAGWAWYGVQVFLQLPYAELGDNYKILMQLNSDIAGDITVNGTVVSLKKGDNDFVVNATQAEGKATLSMQLGVYNGDALAGMTLKFKDIGIYDATNTYHHVLFKDGESTLKDIQVRSGKTVDAPIVTPPDGQVFAGWFNGEERYSAKTAITEDKVYTVKFVNKSEAKTYKVSFYVGEQKIDEQDVVEFGTPDFASVAVAFGYTITGWYTDAALTTPYNEEPVEAELNLYAKAIVNVVTYRHDSSFKEGVEITHGANGEFILTYPDHEYEQGWHIQANFVNLPHEATKEYNFSVEYKLDAGTDGSYQIYDSRTVPDSSGTLTPSAEWKKITVHYYGAEVADGNKFTFELGLVHPVDTEAGNVVFELRNPLVAAVA